MKLLEWPIPPVAAAVVPQVAPTIVAPEGPGYLATAILGAWVVLWFLDRIGRLPGRPLGERRTESFTTSDRALLMEIGASLQRSEKARMSEREVLEHMERLYNLLAYRDHEDGIERFLKFMQDTKVAHKTIDEICDRLRLIEEGLQRRGVIDG